MKKLKPVKPKIKGCLNCGPERPLCKTNRELSVGFGSVDVTLDGKCVWAGDMERQFFPVSVTMEKPLTLRRFEFLARQKPGDWRVKFNGPMNESTFQRQGENKWVLVAQGPGFA